MATRIGLLSDTHGLLDNKLFTYFEQCDEVWHAGDIGDMDIVNQLEQFKPFKAVYGNIDDVHMQTRFPEDLRFTIEGLDVWITHIGGAPPRYNSRVKKVMDRKAPDIFICGHSHILRVKRDNQYNDMLYLNPGAAGNQGFHVIKTALRFELHNGQVKSLEVIELGKRGAL